MGHLNAKRGEERVEDLVDSYKLGEKKRGNLLCQAEKFILA